LQRRERKIAIFTDASNHPAAIARTVCANGAGADYVLWVCENLGSAEERLTYWAPGELHREDFAPLNLVVLLRDPSACGVASANAAALPLLGIPEAALAHRGLITKREIRLTALAYLELQPGNVLWDVGAGSGSMSLEAARLSPMLNVYAIDKAGEHLQENIANFRLRNVHLIVGEAPEALAALPAPDAVFVGGSGGRLLAILAYAVHRLKPGGRLVLSCITLETFSQAWTWLSEHGCQPEATSLQLAHSRPLSHLHCLEPEHPIFLVRVKKP
jgi:precorrin-6Y C5,15-methyltransferase (decarboxylating)